MATDEEIHKFVNDNRELVEKMMAVQKENVEMTKSVGKDVIKMGFESTYMAAEFARKKSEEFFVTTYKMITNPEVQRHFMASGLEFLAGLTALAESAPMPDFVKSAASDMQKNARLEACKANEDCPVKTAMKVRAEKLAERVPELESPAEPEPAKTETAE